MTWKRAMTKKNERMEEDEEEKMQEEEGEEVEMNSGKEVVEKKSQLLFYIIYCSTFLLECHVSHLE